VLEDWQNAGPRRVLETGRARIEEMAREDHLRIGDPQVAALHFIALTTFE